MVESIARFAAVLAGRAAGSGGFLDGLQRLADRAPQPGRTRLEKGIVYRALPSPRGPMGGFGYDYFQDQTAEKGIAAPALLPQSDRLWGGGPDYAYEALNLVDGRRTVRQIRDALAAIYGPVPLAEVAEYLGGPRKDRGALWVGPLIAQEAGHAEFPALRLWWEP